MAVKLAEYRFSTDYDSFENILNRIYSTIGSSAYNNLGIDRPSSGNAGYIRIYDDISEEAIQNVGKICRANGGEPYN